MCRLMMNLKREMQRMVDFQQGDRVCISKHAQHGGSCMTRVLAAEQEQAIAQPTLSSESCSVSC